MVPAGPRRPGCGSGRIDHPGGGGTIAPVRKLIKIALVALGIRALLRWWKRRQEPAQTASTTPPAADPADELRQKLAESRESTSDEPPAAPEASVEERRADVHEQGRAALGEMKPSDEG
jgi:hypothetical protein